MDYCRIVAILNGFLHHVGGRDRGEDGFLRQERLLVRSETDLFGFYDLSMHRCYCYPLVREIGFYCILDLSFEAYFDGMDSH